MDKRRWRLAANLSFLFQEVPFLDRFALAKAAGFDAVEFVCLFDHPPEVMADRARAAGVETVLMNVSHGDWAAGERGLACLPERQREFRDSIAMTVRYCDQLGCRRVNCLAGIAPTGIEKASLRATLISNLAFAHAELAKAGIALQMEPINTIDLPGFFVSTADEAVTILEEAGIHSPALQFDVYHEQLMTSDALGSLERHAARIAHVQIADTPGRNEPGTGSIDFGKLFETLDRIAYEGYVGLEYKPKTTTAEGLTWMRAFDFA